MDNAYDAAPEYGPSPRPRIVHMPISELRIGCPHNLLQLPKLGQETRDSVIDPLCICRDCPRHTTASYQEKFKTKTRTLTLRVFGRSLDIPDRVRLDSLLVTRHFLLLIRPVR